jgi:hypothetical protein
MKFVLVHGFNVKDGGSNTVDQLVPFITNAGHTVDKDETDYGYFNLFMIRLFQSKLRSRMLYRLARAFESADVIITHSNGAYFTTQALNMLDTEFNNSKLVIHISPALDCDTPIPLAVRGQLVLYTKHDFWVKLSSYIPFFPWGRMGAKGYSDDDNRNINRGDHQIPGHSAWFRSAYVGRTWQYCDNYLRIKT